MNTKIDRLSLFHILNGESHSSLLDEFGWMNMLAMLPLTARLHVGFERATHPVSLIPRNVPMANFST
jgi:hypothetical protein